ncbi:MAG: methyltransferase domain-containing protein [Pseudomonadota bacterium]
MMAWSPAGQRNPEEIARIMEVRARRSIDHVTARAYGKTARLCPICNYEGMFSPVKHKPEIWCPSCDSRPRHRLLKLWMDREMELRPGARVLHFAAEAWVRAELEARGALYRTADINDLFDLRLDITDIALPESSEDLIIANHVLEHVDDARAFAEMYRVLRPGGQAVITVPMIEGFDETYEDPAHRSPDQRQLYYGDATHLRWFGRDIRTRFARPGFTVSEYTANEPDAARYALHRGEKIFIGRKAQGGPNG